MNVFKKSLTSADLKILNRFFWDLKFLFCFNCSGLI